MMEKKYKWNKVDILSSLCIFLLCLLFVVFTPWEFSTDETLILCECDCDWFEVGSYVGFFSALAFISFCATVGVAFSYIIERFTIKRRATADESEVSK